MKVAILRDNEPDLSAKWEMACRKFNVEYIVINMLRNDWLDDLYRFNPDFCVSRPPGDIQQNKKVFDEKLFYIEMFTAYKVYPGYHEIVFYENKASLAYFLRINSIPHAETFVSYSREEVDDYIQNVTFPIVAKTLIGATGSGVRIIKNAAEASGYVNSAFTNGITRKFGPNRKTGTPLTWMLKAIKSPGYFMKRVKKYNELNRDVQKGVVLFQHYIPHEFEWRCVKIGDSFFAYKKLKIGDKASGSKLFDYGEPPLVLLDFTRDLCERFGFNFMAVDLFYHNDQIYVNELQTIFGHKNPFICKVGGQTGRYVYRQEWTFEPGEFNTNESYDLRLQVASDLHKAFVLNQQG